MRRFLAGKVSVVEDGRMDGYYEEGEKYRNKRNYVPLVPESPSSPKYRNKRNYVPLVPLNRLMPNEVVQRIVEKAGSH
jgi:hypothetical protein